MRSGFIWLMTILSSLGGFVAICAVLSGGCFYETCPDCPCLDDGGNDGGDSDGDNDSDLPQECNAPPEEVGLDAFIQGTASTGRTFGKAPGNYVTLDPGGTVSLEAMVDPLWTRPPLPEICIDPIGYTWEYGGGQTETGETIGPVTFTSSGTVTMTAAIAAGIEDLSPAVLYATVWTGLFTDSFDRTAIDHDVSGWSYRVADVLDLSPSPQWDINGNRLHGNFGPEGYDAYCAPGRQAMLARPEALDARVTVRQNRGAPTAEPPTPHYSDIILRYQFRGETMQGPDSPFYRVRFHEAAAVMEGTNCVFVDVFRIDVTGQEYGTTLETENSHYLCDWPLGANEWFDIDIQIEGTNPVSIQTSIASTSNPGAYTLTHTFQDSSATRITEPGRYGVSQCWGETFFDDFRLERLN